MPTVYFTQEQLPHKAHQRRSDLTGQKFGKLTANRVVAKYFGKNPRKFCLVWECLCDCGTLYHVQARHLKGYDVTNCGCRREYHGESGSKVFKAYAAMKQRCFNPKTSEYYNYGGRGITVALEWVNSFSSFLEHVGYPPTPYHSLDRINVDGNYEPHNVRWATSKEQASNKRSNRYLAIHGRRQTLTEWATEMGMSPLTLTTRLNLGWSHEDAVHKPVIKYAPRKLKPSPTIYGAVKATMPNGYLIDHEITTIAIKLFRYPTFIILE